MLLNKITFTLDKFRTHLNFSMDSFLSIKYIFFGTVGSPIVFQVFCVWREKKTQVDTVVYFCGSEPKLSSFTTDYIREVVYN